MVMGLFAGRGDVVLAMGLAFLVGGWAGWQCNRLFQYIKNRNEKRS